MNINLRSTISRNPSMVFNKIDDEVVMLSIENNEYYGLNAIGSRIWESIAQPIVFSALVDQLLAEFDVNREQCEHDVIEFLTKLDEKKLIVING
jgi:hypothetical protein